MARDADVLCWNGICFLVISTDRIKKINN